MSIDDRYFYLDLEKPTPLYFQIQENITELIEIGILKDGAMLPSERDLSQLYNVNRLTVRQAIERLVTAGLVRKHHGVGNFVHRTTRFILSAQGFSQRMRDEGLTPSSRLIAAKTICAPLTIAHRLHIRLDEPVFRLERLRLADNEPLMVEVSYLPLHRFPNLMDHNFESESLYHVLKTEYGVPIATAEQTFEPTLLNEHEANLFGLEEGQPAMLVRIMAFDLKQEPIEVGKSVVRGDRCRFYFRIQMQHPIVS